MIEGNEHGVPSAAFRQGRDVYIIYSFEDVAFHWEHPSGRVRRRFKDAGRQSETRHFNRLYMDARMGGRLATKEQYDRY